MEKTVDDKTYSSNYPTPRNATQEESGALNLVPPHNPIRLQPVYLDKVVHITSKETDTNKQQDQVEPAKKTPLTTPLLKIKNLELEI